MTEQQWIRENAAAFRAIDEKNQQIADKIEEVKRRFHMDPEYHARVYTAAKVVMRDVLPPERKLGDEDGRWADALWAALTTAAVLEALTEGENDVQ